mgnify:CR=1 FL=1
MGYSNLKFDKDTVFLVTGGAGFIGSNLCEAILKLGYKVKCLDNLSTGKQENVDLFISNPNYTFIKGDITNLDTCMEACKGVDYVLNQAAWGSVPRSIEMPLYYEEVNIRGTLNMMEAARQNGVKKFVYASSSSVYGDHPVLPKVEGQEGNLLSPYALTKRVDEEYGKLYYKLYGLDTYGMRYFNVFGPRQDPNGAYAAVIPKWVASILNDEVIYINGDGSTSRDFCYIDNAVQANLLAATTLQPDAVNTIYNVAVGQQTSLNELYKYIVDELVRYGVEINSNNLKYRDFREGDVKHSLANISKIKNKLGYEPLFTLKDGLVPSIQWYYSNH